MADKSEEAIEDEIEPRRYEKEQREYRKAALEYLAKEKAALAKMSPARRACYKQLQRMQASGTLFNAQLNAVMDKQAECAEMP